MKIIKKVFIAPVKYYKYCINPLIPNNCRYTPSCSAYMQQAINKRGVFLGIFLGLFRILRCNPFSKGGVDPVKNNYKGNAKWLL